MDLKESIDWVLQSPQRKLVVAENDIDLDTNMRNDIFILIVEESQGSAGGRAAGSGSRRIDRVVGFSCKDGICVKYFEASEQAKIELFNIPYSAVAMDIKLFLSNKGCNSRICSFKNNNRTSYRYAQKKHDCICYVYLDNTGFPIAKLDP